MSRQRMQCLLMRKLRQNSDHLRSQEIFSKIVVRKDIGKRWYDDNGILNINVIDFLLDKVKTRF